MIYIGTFTISGLFAYYAGKSKKKSRTLLLSLVAILIPSLLAGLRSTSIGTDVGYYVINNFETAVVSSSFLRYLKVVYAKEPLYLLLVYVVAKTVGNIQWLLFFFGMITIGGIYFGAWKLRQYCSVPVVMLIYCFLYYNDSLNMVRQYMAMAILFAGMYVLFSGKYKKYCIYIIIASSIHTIASIGIIFIAIHWFVCRRKIEKKKSVVQLRTILLVALAVIAVFGIKLIVTAFVNLGLLDPRYFLYFQSRHGSSHNIDTLIYVLELIFLFLYNRSFKKKIFAFDYLKLNAILNIIFLQLARFMSYGHRISLYFGVINILLIGQFPKQIKKANNRILISCGMLTFFFLYWMFIYCISGVSETYPYKFFK